MLDKLGDSDAALEHYMADLQIRRVLVARDPRDQAIKRSLYVAHSYVALAYEDRGDLQAALEQSRQSLDVASAMARLDPQNADWQRDLMPAFPASAIDRP